MNTSISRPGTPAVRRTTCASNSSSRSNTVFFKKLLGYVNSGSNGKMTSIRRAVIEDYGHVPSTKIATCVKAVISAIQNCELGTAENILREAIIAELDPVIDTPGSANERASQPAYPDLTRTVDVAGEEDGGLSYDVDLEAHTTQVLAAIRQRSQRVPATTNTQTSPRETGLLSLLGLATHVGVVVLAWLFT
ncbi:hypothetical protein DID80_02620 [Candidatus Marinamargulisbacteria bacterium SCGC AAA071-K20]|nr:hypothetical protein DID80_02620 [Candidatus Marinamargulisbacteria bacterium SCGC AAA071-K20]